MSKISNNLALLASVISAQSTVIGSAIALLHGISEQYKQATENLASTGADTSEIDDLTNQIKAQTAKLADAVQANTVITQTATATGTIESAEILPTSELGTDPLPLNGDGSVTGADPASGTDRTATA